MVGLHAKADYGLLSTAFRLPAARAQERMIRERALHHLERVGLADKAEDDALSLPFGQQRLLEIARALATEPSLLLLDEAGSGSEPAGEGRAAAADPRDPLRRRDGAAGGARHPVRDGALRPDRRPRARRKNRRRDPGGNPKRRARDRGLPGRGCPGPMLKIENAEHLLRTDPGAARRLARGRRGRDRGRDRFERRGQIHAAQHHFRDDPIPQRADRVRRHSRSPGCARTGSCAWGSARCPSGARSFRR